MEFRANSLVKGLAFNFSIIGRILFEFGTLSIMGSKGCCLPLL